MKFVSYIKEQHLHQRERIKVDPIKVIFDAQGAAMQVKNDHVDDLMDTAGAYHGLKHNNIELE